MSDGMLNIFENIGPVWMPEPASERPPCWYAVYTRSNFERKVVTELAARQMETYLPSVPEVHQWKDRKKVVEVPVFPGYVFARFVDSAAARQAILHTPGTVRILGHSGMIESVPDEEIEPIRKLLQSNNRCFAHPFLREGAWVRVKRGPLKNLEGLLVRVKNQSRLVLSIALLSQAVATEIDWQDVEVVQARAALGQRVA